MPAQHADTCNCTACVDPRDYCTECGADHIACRCLVEDDPDMPPEDYDFDVSDLDDVTPLPPAPGPTPEQLKRQTRALIRGEHEKRLDRQNPVREMTRDLYDRLGRGELMPSDVQPAPRHPPRLTVVGETKENADG